MQVLVIGGTGFIGPQILRLLAEGGHQVTVFHRGATQASLPSGASEILGDRHDLPQFSAQFERLQADVVIDMICATGQQARTTMDTFRGIAGRVVMLSSCDVYRAYDVFRRKDDGPLEPVPLTETSPLRAHLYPYRGSSFDGHGYVTEDYDKIFAERVVLNNAALPATVLRLPMVFGWRDPAHRFFALIKRMDDTRPAILLEEATARWRSTWGYVDNIAAAVALVATDTRAAGQIYNVSDLSRPTMADWVRELAEVTGWRGRVEIVPEPCPPPSYGAQYNTAQDLVTDSSRIRRELGYAEPVSRLRALEQTVAWERQHPPERIDPKQFDYAAEDEILRRQSPQQGAAHLPFY